MMQSSAQDIARPFKCPEMHNDVANLVEELTEHLPAGHTGYIENDPVVAFLHTVNRSNDSMEVSIYPLTPSSVGGGGYVEVIEPDEEVLQITPAPGAGVMKSLYTRGPFLTIRVTLGYEYPGQSPVDWVERAAAICDMLTAGLSTVIDELEALPRGGSLETLPPKLLKLLTNPATPNALRRAIKIYLHRNFNIEFEE